tara:strand:+ start:462 stop:875 length:414 start_codon:yes stop_codon:yes gene_type:complete
MALDYGMPGPQFTGDGGSMGMETSMLGDILGSMTAKITVETEEIPEDYTGVPKKSKTVEEIDLAELMPGPAPMMMSMGPPPPMVDQMPQMPQQMPQPQMPPEIPMPGMSPMPGPMPGPGTGMGAQAAQQVMQQFGTM